jgi:hypothetical protein
MRKNKLIIIIILPLFLFTSCKKESQVIVPEEQEIIHDSIDMASKNSERSFLETLTDQELQLLNSIRKKGGLEVGFSTRIVTLFGSEDEALKSLHPRLIKEVSGLLGVEYKYRFVGINDIFSINGSIPHGVTTDPWGCLYPGYIF